MAAARTFRQAGDAVNRRRQNWRYGERARRGGDGPGTLIKAGCPYRIEARVPRLVSIRDDRRAPPQRAIAAADDDAYIAMTFNNSRTSVETAGSQSV